MIRKFVTNQTHFLILTETKTPERKYRYKKMKYTLKPTLITGKETRQAGVAIYSHSSFTLIPGSARYSDNPGHFVCGVYKRNLEHILVAGIYGEPSSADKISERIITDMAEKLTELKLFYTIHKTIIGGDLNLTFHASDTSRSSETILYKPRSRAAFETLLDTFQLVDTAKELGKPQHTWHSMSQSPSSSRLDYIFVDKHITDLNFQQTTTIFDHDMLSLQVGRARKKSVYNFQDHILSTDEFLITFQDTAQDILRNHNVLLHQQVRKVDSSSDESDIEDLQDTSTPWVPQLTQMNNVLNTQDTTALQLLNSIIQQATRIHSNISQYKKNRDKIELADINRTLNRLTVQKRHASTQQDRENIQQQIKLQRHKIAQVQENRDAASEIRIENFYKSNIGKNVPVTYRNVKDRPADRQIRNLIHNDTPISDPQQIQQIMFDHYQQTANQTIEQTVSLDQFIQSQSLPPLPHLTEDQKQILTEDITCEEVKWALQNASTTSAPGPSGQTISLYRLLYVEAPTLLTSAINQLAFCTDMTSLPDLQWIKKRKVIYIPKNSSPSSPSDYRPLSMLEVLYKIPSRIIARRLNDTLNTVIGDHQHGFRQARGIQEPLLLATHALQDSLRNNKSLQLASFDIEKAFDRVSHIVIQQALHQFQYPPIIIEAISKLALSGQALIEVNDQLSPAFQIATGSGQGDPLSSTLFIIAIEPLNRALVHNLQHIFYVTTEGIKIGLLSFADDNLSLLMLQSLQDFRQLQNIYSDYATVSGLHINLRKTNVLCINTPDHLLNALHEIGVNTPTTIKYLGIQLSTTLKDTINNTIHAVQSKSVRRRILATSTPTDMLHRSILLNRTLIPLYTHIFMSLPAFPDHIQQICTDITNFMWQKMSDGVLRNKRKLVAKMRLSASYEMGGLQLINIPDMVEGLQINLIQKLVKKGSTYIIYKKIVDQLLSRLRLPSLEQHVQSLGPIIWKYTSTRLLPHNQLLSQAFAAVSKLLVLLERKPDNMLYLPICGHSLSPELYKLTSADALLLQESGLFTVSQLFSTSDRYTLLSTFNSTIPTLHSIQNKMWLITKLQKLHEKLVAFPQLSLQNNSASYLSILSILINGQNLSQLYKKLTCLERDQAISVPPAYLTRLNDNIPTIPLQDFKKSYDIVSHPLLSSKTKEIAFQTLNRTLWTNNKAFKSGIHNTPLCPFCQQTETMEHLLADCDEYSGPRWENLSKCMTSALREYMTSSSAAAPLTYRSIFFHQEIPTLRTYKLPINIRQSIQLLIHETRRHIYNRRISSTIDNDAPRTMTIHSVLAHNALVTNKVISYLKYISYMKWKDAILFLTLVRNYVNDTPV